MTINLERVIASLLTVTSLHKKMKSKEMSKWNYFIMNLSYNCILAKDHLPNLPFRKPKGKFRNICIWIKSFEQAV